MGEARGVGSLLRRLLGDEPFRETLALAGSDERRRELIAAAGFTHPFTRDDVVAAARRLVTAPESATIASPDSASEAAPPSAPSRRPDDPPWSVRSVRMLAPLLGRLAAAAARDAAVADQARHWPPLPLTYVIAGTQKGGTTALDLFLSQHPDVCTARPKETHFFHEDVYFEDGVARYEWLAFCFSHHAGEHVVGEATPEYMYLPNAGPRLAAHNPALRIILLLRDPAERAYSDYRMRVSRGQEPLPFRDALEREPERLAAAAADFRLASQLVRHSYIARGLYAEQLRRLLRHFPREQLLVLRSEHLRDRHYETLEAVYAFLGLRGGDIPEPRRVLVGEGPPMSAADRAHLRDVFAPSVRELEDLLGWDLADWLV